MASIVEMRNVTAWRGDTRVFEGLSLDILPGVSTAVLGPNGSGKSTFLRLLSREIHPEHREGSAMRLFGRERWNVWELRSRIGIVSHDLQSGYPRHLTGTEVVLSGFRSSLGVWAHQRYTVGERERVGTILWELGVSRLADRRYATLSTGEQRRFLLARALVHDPEVLVLDEPTSGLDPAACFQYLEIVRGLIREGKTLVLVTHHLHEIPPEVERAVLLREGRVVAEGRMAEVLTGPRLSEAFGSAIQVVELNGFRHAFPGGASVHAPPPEQKPTSERRPTSEGQPPQE
jgi:iron complex transport system ATP-binding protein